LDLNCPDTVADWLISQSDRLEYNPENYR
jgi:hypothetical protein